MRSALDALYQRIERDQMPRPNHCLAPNIDEYVPHIEAYSATNSPLPLSTKPLCSIIDHPDILATTSAPKFQISLK